MPTIESKTWALRPLKKGQVAVTVTYHITKELVNVAIPFIRYNCSRPSEGIPAIYIDDKEPKKPTQTITFAETGEHIVRIVLKNSEIIPEYLLIDAQNIYSVEIPDSVTMIERCAFRRCEIECPPVLPPNLKIVDGRAFESVYDKVDSLQLPDSVETITFNSFAGAPHLIVGKHFKQSNGGLQDYTKVTIPADNLYLEVRDGFVIDRSSNVLQYILPGTFNNVEDVTIRIPDGIKGFKEDLIKAYGKVSLFVPGSVEKAHLLPSSPELTMECAEGVKKIKIDSARRKLNLVLPSTVGSIELWGVVMDRLSVPRGVTLSMAKCCVTRLDVGDDVILSRYCFNGFKGEVFVGDSLHFDDFGGMEDDSVIHVPDEETAKKIFYSSNFNKEVKIFIGEDKLFSEQQEGGQGKRLLALLGIADFPYSLESRNKQAVALLFNFTAKTTVEIKTKAVDEYMLDDGEAKKFRGKIAVPKGAHIIRLFGSSMMLNDDPGSNSEPCNALVIEPSCDVMLIDDNVRLYKISKRIRGIKHLVLGAQCNIEETFSIGGKKIDITKFRLPVERMSVVPENQWLEGVDGCVVKRDNKKLLFANCDVQRLPSGILAIEQGALNSCQQEQLVIPGSVKEVTLSAEGDADALSNLKKIVFEEGVESVSLGGFSFCPDLKVTFPATLKKLSLNSISASHILVPYACELGTCWMSHVENLEFQKDVSLIPDFGNGVLDKFSGNIRFHGAVKLFQKSVSGKDGLAEFFGTPNDDCTITVSRKETVEAIKKSEGFNPNVKVEIK